MSPFLWYELMSTDPASAMRFYPGITGWHAERYESSPAPYWVWMNGATPLGGLMPLPDEAAQGGAPSHWMPYVGCSDIEATVKQARALGARVYVPPTDIHDTGRFAVLADPQGAVFSVFAPTTPPASGDGSAMGAFAWHELVTSDAAAAFDFYSALFGWERTRSIELGTGGVYQMYGAGGDSFGGMFDGSRTSAMPPHWLLHVRVPDVDRAAACVAQLGGTVVHVHDVPGGSRIAECCDPQGARFALTSRRPDQEIM